MESTNTTGSPLVGRARKLAAIKEAFAAAQRSEGRVLLFAGGPGLGKPRLTTEALALAEERGCLVAAGRVRYAVLRRRCSAQDVPGAVGRGGAERARPAQFRVRQSRALIGGAREARAGRTSCVLGDVRRASAHAACSWRPALRRRRNAARSWWACGWAGCAAGPWCLRLRDGPGCVPSPSVLAPAAGAHPFAASGSACANGAHVERDGAVVCHARHLTDLGRAVQFAALSPVGRCGVSFRWAAEGRPQRRRSFHDPEPGNPRAATCSPTPAPPFPGRKTKVPARHVRFDRHRSRTGPEGSCWRRSRRGPRR